MSKLYELTEQYDRLLHEHIDTTTGELLDAETSFLAQLAEIKESIQDKSVNIGKVVLMLNADIKAISDEEARLASLKRTARNKVAWLKQYLLDQLTLANIDEIDNPTVKISIRTNPPSVEIYNQSIVPAQYLVIPPIEVNKSKILKDWKETGNKIDGVNIIDDKKRVDIK